MRVLGTMSAQALHVIQSLMSDPEVSPAVRLDCAKTTLDRAGFVSARTPGQAAVPAVDSRPITEMEVAELRGLVAAIETVQRERATGTPILNY
jgi:hypothetical protein